MPFSLKKCVIPARAISVLAAVGLWMLFPGFCHSHARAVSPDGECTAESRNLYRPGPMYGWNHYYVRVHPRNRIRCTASSSPWRGTPPDITSWKYEHRYATYNDFDDQGQFPTGIRWVSNKEFVIEGGEGDGSTFEVDR